MSGNRTKDPYDSIKTISVLWEKQINDLIFLWTNNSEYVKASNVGTKAHTRYLEKVRKNQEMIGNLLNIPTKSDVANVANLTIQTENKIDALEEQIWELQDTIKTTNSELEGVVEVSKEMIKLTKQLKTELDKSKKELAETNNLQSDIQELKEELSKLTSVKEDIELLKGLVKKDKVEEPVLVGTGPKK